MTTRFNRRDFLKHSTAGALAAAWHVNPLQARESSSPNEKLNIAVVGTGHKGWHNVQQLTSQNISVLCDIDTTFLGKAAEQFSMATQYRDYRRMLDKEYKNIDAVVVSTSDHVHAPATSVALDLGKHVYCEKPLTHTVQEARAIAELAARKGVATQMGTQVHASTNYRRVVEAVQSGVIGPVTEVYNWCNKGWSNGRFTKTDMPAPANLDWNLWLGPAKKRPFSPDIHPSNWRRFWEYGSGTFGDMAAHVMDLPFWALNLTSPTSVVCEGPPVHPDGAPEWVKATYQFPAHEGRGAVDFHWSDGGAHFDLVANTNDHAGKPLSKWGLGVLFVGEKGMLAANYGQYQVLPQADFADFTPPPKTIPDSIGHWNEWVEACKTGKPTTCNFQYAGRLTETILLGIVAFRSQERVEWNSADLSVGKATTAGQYVEKPYRKGFEVVGIG